MIIFLSSVIILIPVSYLILQSVYAFYWTKFPETAEKNLSEYPEVTILIAFRNEAANIGLCLQGILNQQYPVDKFKVLLINDHSEDNSVQVIESYLHYPNVVLQNLPSDQEGKKKCIAYGLKSVSTPYLLLTDADCLANPAWLRSMMYEILHQKADAACGPVSLMPQSGVLEAFQALDFAGMMAITAVAIHKEWFYLANGANLLVRMQVLDPVHIHWQSQYASGDDISLLSHLVQKGSKICFVKNEEAIVKTQAQSRVSDLFQQRLRWGTKNKSIKNPTMLFQLGLVYLVSVLFIIGLIGMFYDPFWLILLLFKMLGDLVLLIVTAPFFSLRKLLVKIPVLSIIHSAYIVVIGSLSLLPIKYSWKGRRVI